MARGRKGTVDLELTKAMADDLVRVLNLGMTNRDACRFAGCTETSFYKWLRIGKEKPAGNALHEFAQAVGKAQAKAKVASVGYVFAGMKKDWKAAAWLLSVQHPKEYGPKVKVTLETEFDAALKRLEKVLPPELYEKALDAIAGGEGEDEDSGPAPGDPLPSLG